MVAKSTVREVIIVAETLRLLLQSAGHGLRIDSNLLLFIHPVLWVLW